MMSPGGRRFPPCTSKRPLHIMGPFQGQNCINKEQVNQKPHMHVVSFYVARTIANSCVVFMHICV
jgi:hypothetical protein